MGIVIISSCKKDDENKNSTPNPQPVYTADYTPMEIGYYWVYEWFRIDSSGNETPMNKRDSISITKDTLIGGETFFTFEGTTFGNNPARYFLRDSSNYLVSNLGIILFSSTNFSDVLNIDTLHPVAVVHYQMNHMDTTINVPFGTFDTYDYEGTVYPNNPTYPWGIQYLHNFYGKNVGVIKSTNYYFNAGPTITIEKRLVDCNVPMEL